MQQLRKLQKKKYNSLKPKTIFDLVKEFGDKSINNKGDLRESYYQERAKKYGFEGSS
jgi:hypothetical protein